MKKARLRKIIKALRDNPSIMCSSDIYAAVRDWGLNNQEAGEVKDKMEDEVFWGLELFEDAGI